MKTVTETLMMIHLGVNGRRNIAPSLYPQVKHLETLGMVLTETDEKGDLWACITPRGQGVIWDIAEGVTDNE